MATYNLALILGNPSNDAEFLLAKQTPPPKLGIEEYDSFVDSDLWDLPSKKLELVEGEWEAWFLEQVGFTANDGGEWRFLKHLEEARFWPRIASSYSVHFGKIVEPESEFARIIFYS
ncbi:hypothetical protein OIU76_011687 [Salix suchowensis]|nr:hypothetical protein OIU76_011687 [Salix suchowensis]